MPTALIALGSNLGESAAILGTALSELDALPDLRVERCSSFHSTRPVGGEQGQSDYLNAVAVVETTIAPLVLLGQLQRIESRHGRTRTTRWAARTLDLDLLLYGSQIIDTATLNVPHMRMAYRRFVLEPAAEVAPAMIHPVVGWPLERLILHLDAARDVIALLTPSLSLRNIVDHHLSTRFGMAPIPLPTFATAGRLWPAHYATWLAVPAPRRTTEPAGITRVTTLPYAAAAFPKLSILIDGERDATMASRTEWSQLVRQPGRGPTLRLRDVPLPEIKAELDAAVESVWPDLGPQRTTGVE